MSNASNRAWQSKIREHKTSDIITDFFKIIKHVKPDIKTLMTHIHNNARAISSTNKSHTLSRFNVNGLMLRDYETRHLMLLFDLSQEEKLHNFKTQSAFTNSRLIKFIALIIFLITINSSGNCFCRDLAWSKSVLDVKRSRREKFVIKTIEFKMSKVTIAKTTDKAFARDCYKQNNLC